jgi:hypothetical protein
VNAAAARSKKRQHIFIMAQLCVSIRSAYLAACPAPEKLGEAVSNGNLSPCVPALNRSEHVVQARRLFAAVENKINTLSSERRERTEGKF